MAIYDKPTKELIKEFLKTFVVPKSEGFGLIERKPIQNGGYFSRQEIISWFTKNYPKINWF